MKNFYTILNRILFRFDRELENEFFKRPKYSFYFGNVIHGTPYFYPRNWVSTIISISVSKKTFNGKLDNFKQFSRAWKIWRFKLLGRVIAIQLGTPIILSRLSLGWKDKYNTPRFEWSPAFQIYFFGLEFSIFLTNPVDEDLDSYWEHVLWVMKYSDGDIDKAKETWEWKDNNGKSTWDNKYLKK
jgi:hypothetical protein